MTIQNYCFNCLSAIVYPKVRFVHETENLRATYGCRSFLEWHDYDQTNRTWTVSISLKCKPRHDFSYDEVDNDY